MATAEKEKKADLDFVSARDSYIPLFDGTLSGYREWRKRILIYYKKMCLSKRQGEAILNLLGSLSGTAWKLCEDFDIEQAENDKALDHILTRLDSAFRYDSKVELPADFSAYFEHLQRRQGQTLLQFVTDHDDKLKQVEKHGVKLPDTVQGWHLLAKSGLTREQKQMIMTQSASLERAKVQQAMYAILGQDYKGGGQSVNSRWQRPFNSTGKGRGYFAGDDNAADLTWDNPSAEWEPEDEGTYYLDDEQGDEWYDEFDDDAAYFQEECDTQEHDGEFDVSEYDEAYATYTDARKRFNDLKMSRGFLPVVALQDQSSTATSSQAPRPQFGKGYGSGFGKGKKGKSKGKGKSSTYRYNKPPHKQADPKGRARSALAPACMRCGSTAHRTAQCNAQSSTPKPSTTGSGKRQAVESVATLADEQSMVIFEDSYGRERPDCAMLDPGASSFLMGSGPLIRYVHHLKQLGFDTNDLQLNRCERTFHFGGDHQKVSTWTCKLPFYINNTYGVVQGFVLKGETPMLIGRPVIQALEMTIDFSQQRLKFGDHPWQQAVLGKHEEYLLALTDTFDSDQLSMEPSFDLQLEETLGDPGTFDDFLTEEHIYQVEESIEDQGSPMPMKRWKTLISNSQTQLNRLHAYVDNVIREEGHPPPRVLWEVYAGKSRLSQLAEALGMKVEVFSFATGWNFSLASHRALFMQRLQEEEPDELFLSPSCGPWSKMQNISATTEQRKEALYTLREWHHRVHLGFCKQAYLQQVQHGRHAHLEQPTQALSWSTNALKHLPGHNARFHQCRYGCVCCDTDGVWRPAKKDTTIRTTKRAVAESMNLLCDHSHEHCRLEGHIPGIGKRTSYMEDYQPAFAAVLGTAISACERPQAWDGAFAVQEMQSYLGKLVDLHAEGKQEALRVVQKLHRNLGHPSAQSLVDLLTARGASATVLSVAENYLCSSCLRYKKPNQAAPASIKEAQHFNQVVQSDVFWIKLGKKKMPILAILDVATRFQAAALLDSERTQDYIKALERHWVAHFGVPQQLITDEGRGWLSDEFGQWTDEHSILHNVAPGEAHERLGHVERRHSVLRKALEVYMHDLSLEDRDGVKQALAYVLPQLNAQPTVSGYSPTQWVLGYQPAQPGLLSSADCALKTSDDFEEHLH